MRPTKRVVGEIMILVLWFAQCILIFALPTGIVPMLLLCASIVLATFAFALWAAVCDGDDDNA